VAEGRGLPQAKVLEIARGRVWTGEDALALGLVDALGGFPVALRLAKEAAGISPEVGIRLKIFPPKKPFFQVVLQQLMGDREESQGGEAGATMLSPSWESLSALTDLAKRLHSGPIHGILTMPNVEVGR
jgi:protease-4